MTDSLPELDDFQITTVTSVVAAPRKLSGFWSWGLRLDPYVSGLLLEFLEERFGCVADFTVNEIRVNKKTGRYRT